ncbi:hypothetical protein F4819DRAFT_474245 [Hypoxylon fuscum]|nr:hypothetical protein F4819DRAFT_474245 [Hypoxylon fuscum]
MATQDQSLSSNNPFRRKLGSPPPSSKGPTAAPALTSSFDGSSDSIPRPPFTTFRSAQSREPRREEQEEETIVPVQPKPKKVVKRVRVQSPPPSSPSSPEDAAPVTRFPRVEDLDDYDGESSDSREDEGNDGPFNRASFGTRDRDNYEHTQRGPPANPFSKTLHDLEQTGQDQDDSALAANAAAKGTLDVDSFKRLLLTGYSNIPARPSASASEAGPLSDGASNTETSSVSRQSIFDTILQDTPRTSHVVSEPEDAEERRGILPSSPLSQSQSQSHSHASSSSTRKKPPPPSSRHGKLIKIELGSDTESRTGKDSAIPISINTTSLPAIAPPRKTSSQSVPALQVPPQPTDVNKPLPQTPFRPSVEEAVDSPFDREAIGKVPEPFAEIQSNPRPPTPPVLTRNRSESNGSTQLRKPAAPPPRRHGRSDSRAPSVINADDDTPPRSSLESTRSRADSVRANIGINVPTPPPPRRPNHARQGSYYASPNQATFASPNLSESERSPTGMGLRPASSSGQTESLAGLATFSTTKDGLPKLSPPPPPPARQASTRRPPSVRSMDLGNGPATIRKVSREKEGVVAPPPPPPRQRGSSRASVETPAPAAEGARSVSGESQNSTQAAGDTKQGQEILADIDALQKEVDALMGKYGKPDGN